MSIDFIKSQNLICGATGSGKSTFVRKILTKTRFRFGVIATTTPWEYADIKNGLCIGFDELDKIVDVVFKAKGAKFVVIDNYVGVYKISGCVEKLFTQGRHFNCAVFLLTQYAAKCPPVCRENARYTWVFRSCCKTYELLYDLQNRYSKKRDFIEFMQKRSGYKPILINNADLSLSDNIIVL